jgi:hypothetical protein
LHQEKLKVARAPGCESVAMNALHETTKLATMARMASVEAKRAMLARRERKNPRGHQRNRRDEPEILDSAVHSLPLHRTYFVDVAGFVVPVDRDDETRANGGFGGGDPDGKDGET